MTGVDQLYTFFLQVNEESEKILNGWNKHFLWLEDVVLSAIESKGKTVIPKTPAARKRKRKVSKENIDPTIDDINKSPGEQIAKKRKAETQRAEATVVLRKLSNSEASKESQDQENVEEIIKPSRQTRKRKVKEDVNETSKHVEENYKEVTRKYSKAVSRKKVKVSEIVDISNQSAEIEDDLTSKKSKVVEKKLKEKETSEESENNNYVVVKTPVPAPRQRPLRSTRCLDSIPCTPTKSPAIITKAGLAKKQKTPREKIIQECKPATAESTTDEDHWPFRKSTRIGYSPAPKTVHVSHSGLHRQPSYNSADSLFRSAFESNRDSGVKIVKHAWSATGKTLSVKAARIPYTPSASVDNRMKVLQLKKLSASKTGGKHSFLKSASPHISSRLAYPSSETRVGNIVTGVNSFLTRVQPAKPSQKEIERTKQLELERKKEKEDEIRRKKEEMLKLRTDEKKRKNEERMRRAHEARENKERQLQEARIAMQKERIQREEEKAKEELERRRKEEDKIKEEKLLKKKLLQEKKEEKEMARLLKLKEQEEREQVLETLRREEEAQQLRERRLIEEQKKLLEMQEERRILEEKLHAQRLENEKRDEALQKAFEEERIAKEKQESKLETVNETFTKESPTVVTSYEITPVSKLKKEDPNNYDIDDCRSDDSTDVDTEPKKDIPLWAKGQQFRKSLFDQEYFAPDADLIFPPNQLLLPINLDKIFYRKRSRFFTRTSSANWNTPPLKE